MRRLAVVATHPIQYHTPLYQALAARPDLAVEVLFAHRQDAAGQARAGYGVAFDWDVPLLAGYPSRFLRNCARRPDASTLLGCDVPEVGDVLREGRFDALLVHGWASRAYWQAILAARRLGLRVGVRGDSHLGTPRGPGVRVTKRLLYPLALRSSFHSFLAVGTRAREYYLHYGAHPGDIELSPHCVDNERFGAAADAARSDRAALRLRLGVSPEGQVVAFVGRLLPLKRVGDLIDAVARLRAGGREVSLLVAGDGPLRQELERRAEGLDVPLRLLGFVNQSELPAVYAAADALALPSSQETWGLVCNEAMACGLPVVVSDGVGCAPDLVVAERTGAVHPIGDVGALAAALDRVLGDAVRLGAEARRHIAASSPARAAAGIMRGLFGLHPQGPA